ncbi:AAA family ATPase [Anatilimnocola sp. NA78]|uniref:AAA family ATPase n=1 Tax=Anatilimnocola sp. NA78 TaxID=3415683 RepID=UPI003CE48413
MSLTERLDELVRACFTGIWIESHEHEDALAEIAQLCRAQDWRLAVWDLDQGLNLVGAPSGTSPVAADPLSAVKVAGSLPPTEQPTLVVLVNFHRFLGAVDVVQALTRQIVAGKQTRISLVILASQVALPTELEKQFVVVEHALPGREQLAEIARGIATQPDELPDPVDFERVLDAAAGLTRYEAEGAFSLSLIRHGRLCPEVLWEQKTQLLKKSGLLTLHRGGESFAQLGGLESLKAFCLRALRRPGDHNPLVRPRGVLLLSPPGCGKSQFAKALGHETGRPTLVLDLGAMLGSLVGESERNLRLALKLVDVMAPCVLYADELEKSLAGVSGNGDSGVSARLFAQLLVWLNDHTSDVFFIGTCNDISRLPPEFPRAERFDGVVFIDLPEAAQRRRIWEQYLQLFQLDAEQARPQDEQWTGAEIRACCRLAALLDVPLTVAAQNIAPIAVTAAESVEHLRTWATGRCLSADRPGIYQQGQAAAPVRRKVSRPANQN